MKNTSMWPTVHLVVGGPDEAVPARLAEVRHSPRLATLLEIEHYTRLDAL